MKMNNLLFIANASLDVKDKKLRDEIKKFLKLVVLTKKTSIPQSIQRKLLKNIV